MVNIAMFSADEFAFELKELSVGLKQQIVKC